MSNVKISQLPSGNFNAKVYDYTDAAGKRHYKSITAPSKSEVKKQIAMFLANREEATGSIENITLLQAVDNYIASKNAVLSPSTLRGYLAIRNNNMKELMPRRLRDIRSDDIQRAVNEEAATHSPKTVRNMHSLITAAILMYNPDFRVKTTLPQKVKPSIDIPTEEEMKIVFESVKGSDMELPIMLAALCGMRRSEIAGLQWSNVDLKHKTITIDAATVLDTENNAVLKGTKTVSSQRTIRVFAPVMKLIQQKAKEEDRKDAVVPLTPDIITKRFFAVLKRLQLPHYRFHDLRHYAVSVMLSLNIPKSYIADYMGHETENMIDTVYGHIMQKAKKSFEDVVDDYYEKLL